MTEGETLSDVKLLELVEGRLIRPGLVLRCWEAEMVELCRLREAPRIGESGPKGPEGKEGEDGEEGGRMDRWYVQMERIWSSWKTEGWTTWRSDGWRRDW